MTSLKIAIDATVLSEIERIRNPTDYVRSVWSNMHEVRKPGICIRIGVTGQGKAPHYRVEFEGREEWPNANVIQTFHGRSHKPFIDEQDLTLQNWSSRTNSLADIVGLMMQLAERGR